MKELTKEEQDYLKGYAEALQNILHKITGDEPCYKSYDPIDFWKGKIHSYVFDLKDGGRHHPLSDYESIDEIKEWMLKQVKEEIEEEFESDNKEEKNNPIQDRLSFVGGAIVPYIFNKGSR